MGPRSAPGGPRLQLQARWRESEGGRVLALTPRVKETSPRLASRSEAAPSRRPAGAIGAGGLLWSPPGAVLEGPLQPRRLLSGCRTRRRGHRSGGTVSGPRPLRP